MVDAKVRVKASPYMSKDAPKRGDEGTLLKKKFVGTTVETWLVYFSKRIGVWHMRPPGSPYPSWELEVIG